MRARYYESGSGRFLSQDPDYNGGNWFAYCHNDPINSFDGSGREDQTFNDRYYGWLLAAFGFATLAAIVKNPIAGLTLIVLACTCCAAALSATGKVSNQVLDFFRVTSAAGTLAGVLKNEELLGEDARTQVLAGIATVYVCAIVAALAYALLGT